MKKFIMVLLITGLVAMSSMLAEAMDTDSVKLTPFGVDYPLIKSTAYRSPEGDPYGRSFGIRRWFVAAGADMTDWQKTIQESKDVFEIYGGFGVLGHGEEVFTAAAAKWRKDHRGR